MKKKAKKVNLNLEILELEAKIAPKQEVSGCADTGAEC